MSSPNTPPTPTTPTTPPRKYTSNIKFSSKRSPLVSSSPLKTTSSTTIVTNDKLQVEPIEQILKDTSIILPLELFKGKIFVIIGFEFKETSNLKTLIKKLGGDVSFQPNKNVNYCITTKEEHSKNSSKIQQVLKFSTIEILSKEFIVLSISKGLIDLTDLVRLHKPSNTDGSNNNNNNSGSTGSNSIVELLTSTSIQKIKQKKEINLNQLELISKSKRKLKLFISSTFLDMVKEREYIVTYLVPQLKEYCNSRFIDFTFVDMRWGITNEEMKRKNTIATCLSEVSTSNYFISLLGNRYGWCSGTAYEESYQLASSYFHWLKDTNQFKNKSITELEILQSLQPGSKRHNLFYLKSLSKNTTDSNNTDEIDNGDDQTIESIEKLKNLKISLLKSGKTIVKYNEINELLSIIYKDLIKQIEIDYPINQDNNYSLFEVDQHISYSQSLLNNYIVNNPMALTKLNQFVVSSQVRNGIASSPSGQVILVTSPSGYGKSTFLANWLHKVSQSKTILDPKKSLVIMCHIGITSKSKSRWEILKQLYQVIRSHYQINVPISDQDSTSLLEEMNYWFDVATRDGRKLVWILDGIDNIEKVRPDETVKELLQWLPTKFTSNIKIIISSSNSSDHFEYLSKTLYNDGGSNVITLKGFESIDEILQYSKDYLKSYSKELDPVQIELLKKLNAPCESPIFLSTVLSELISIGNFQNLNEKLVSLLTTQFVLALYITIINRWEADENYPKSMVPNILSLIYLSDIGLYENDILEILELKSSFGFFSSIRSIFNGNNFFTINNATFKLAIKFKYFPMDNDDDNLTSIKLKSDLSNYFITALKRICGNGSGHNSDLSICEISRKVEYLPKLLKNINDKSGLKDFLLDFTHLQYLISNDSSRRSLIKYWSWLGYSSNEMIKFYQNSYINYKLNRPPMEEFSQITYYLGKLFEYLSFYDLAFEFLDSAKEYHVQLYGELHPRVLLDDQTLSLISIKKSKFDTAEYLADRSLNVAETLYGKDQIGTCESLQLNGLIKKKKTCYKESKEFYEQAIKILFRFLGYQNNDPNSNNNNTEKSSQCFNSKLADLYNNLGDIYRKLEGQVNFEKALSYYNKTLEIYSNLRDKKHPSFSELYKNLGLVAKKLGNYKEAEKNYLIALDIIESNFGKDHVDYGLYLCDLADTKRKEDDYVEAEKLYNQSLEILLGKLGEMNIEVAEIYNDLGLIRKKLGHYKEAIEKYNKAIHIAEETLGKSHQKVSFYNHNLADCYRKLGDYKKAEVLFNRCLIITQDHLGIDHPEVSEILNSLGLVYKKQSKYNFAEREYKRAITIIARSFGQDHYKIGVYSNNLADVYRKLGKHDQAKALYTKALGVIEKSLGTEHSEYAEVLYGIGLNNKGLEQYDSSIQLIERAIAIVRKELGDSIAKVGIYLNSLAEVKISKLTASLHKTVSEDELSEIRECFKKSYEILVQDLGENHPEIADIWINRAECEFKWGSHQLSKEYFEKALVIIKETFDEDHIKFKTISDRIRYF